MPSLFEIGEDLRALDALIEERGGEITGPDVWEAWEAWLNELAVNEAAKLDGCVNIIRQWEMEASAARAEADQYLAKARTRDNRIAWMKSNLKLHLESTGRKKVETATKRAISIQANGGNAPIVLVPELDPSKIPDELAIVRRTPDLEAIRKHLAEGGVLDFAVIGERGNHLRIK